MAALKDKTIFITGSTRGIGRAMALRFARDGANVVITGKTVDPHPKLSGTIYSVAKEVEAAGGKALALALDVREEQSINAAIDAAVAHFGGLDILVNNASAINLTNTLDTRLNRFDLMIAVNVRATFACSRAAIPHLLKSKNPHILNLSPPLNMEAKWFKNHLAYTYSKYGMSICTLGMSAEFREQGLAVNSLWPRTTIATAAIEVHFPPEILAASRDPSIMADAAYEVVTKNSQEVTGKFFIDEEVLQRSGVTDFAKYSKSPGNKLMTDLFLD